jgi:hypothetical protein
VRRRWIPRLRRRAGVRDAETGETFDVAYDDLEVCKGLPPTA